MPGGRKKGSQLRHSTCGGLAPHTEDYQEGRRDRRAYTHLLLGLLFPLRVAIPPPTSSMPLQGQSPRPESKPQLTEMTEHHPENAPASPLTATSEERRVGAEGLCQPAQRRPVPQSPRPPSRPRPLTLAGTSGGLCPAGQDGRSRRRPGAPDPRRGGAGPARGRLRGAGRQAGARHGSRPIQHFAMPRFPSGGRARLKYQSRPSRGAQELTSAAPGF